MSLLEEILKAYPEKNGKHAIYSTDNIGSYYDAYYDRLLELPPLHLNKDKNISQEYKNNLFEGDLIINLKFPDKLLDFIKKNIEKKNFDNKVKTTIQNKIDELIKNALIEEMIQMVENISNYEFVEKVQKRIKERTKKDMEIEDVKDLFRTFLQDEIILEFIILNHSTDYINNKLKNLSDDDKKIEKLLLLMLSSNVIKNKDYNFI